MSCPNPSAGRDEPCPYRVRKLLALFAYGSIVSKSREITVETERLLIIRRRYQALEEWCDGCGELALMIRPDQAAAVTGHTLRAIFIDVENGRLHFGQMAPPKKLYLRGAPSGTVRFFARLI